MTQVPSRASLFGGGLIAVLGVDEAVTWFLISHPGKLSLGIHGQTDR